MSNRTFRDDPGRSTDATAAADDSTDDAAVTWQGKGISQMRDKPQHDAAPCGRSETLVFSRLSGTDAAATDARDGTRAAAGLVLYQAADAAAAIVMMPRMRLTPTIRRIEACAAAASVHAESRQCLRSFEKGTK